MCHPLSLSVGLPITLMLQFSSKIENVSVYCNCVVFIIWTNIQIVVSLHAKQFQHENHHHTAGYSLEGCRG